MLKAANAFGAQLMLNLVETLSKRGAKASETVQSDGLAINRQPKKTDGLQVENTGAHVMYSTAPGHSVAIARQLWKLTAW